MDRDAEEKEGEEGPNADLQVDGDERSPRHKGEKDAKKDGVVLAEINKQGKEGDRHCPNEGTKGTGSGKIKE